MEVGNLITEDYAGKQSINFVISELVNNIYDHTSFEKKYASHGYIFNNEDLYNYFMGCVWYNPTCKAEDFDDSVLNEYEKANLEILASMDTY